jgi:peptidoglycan hydrolase-like protein with peptidoglycan-binding domain
MMKKSGKSNLGGWILTAVAAAAGASCMSWLDKLKIPERNSDRETPDPVVLKHDPGKDVDLSNFRIRLRKDEPEKKGKGPQPDPPLTLETAVLDDVLNGRLDWQGQPLKLRPERPAPFSPAVQELQLFLIDRFKIDLSPYGADGKFGRITEAALIKCLKEIGYLIPEPLEVDSKILKELFKHKPRIELPPVSEKSATLLDVKMGRKGVDGRPVILKKQKSGSMFDCVGVREVQELLGVVPVDGKFGPITAKAVIDFKIKVGLIPASADRGQDTWARIDTQMARAVLEKWPPFKDQVLDYLKQTDWFDSLSEKGRLAATEFVQNTGPASLELFAEMIDMPTFCELAGPDKEKAINVMLSATLNGRGHFLILLNRLVEPGDKLAVLDQDCQGESTLHRLNQIASENLHPSLGARRSKLLSSIIEEIANPYKSNNQDRHGTCSVTSALFKFFMECPGESCRIAFEMMRPEGRTRAADGRTWIVRKPDALSSDFSFHRSETERLLQAPLMGRNYSNTHDAFIDPETGKEVSWGLSLVKLAQRMSALYNRKFEAKYVSDSVAAEHLLARIESQPTSFTIVSLRWRALTAEEQKEKRWKGSTHSYHAVNHLFWDRKDSTYKFRNPHGPSGSPEAAKENPPRVVIDRQRAIECMQEKEYQDRLSGAVLEV